MNGNIKQFKRSPTPMVIRPLLAERCCLRSVVPNVGMKYPSEKRLMHDVRRENRVLDALESVGCEMVRRSVTHTFADMFRVAGPIVSTKRAKGHDLWDILPFVQCEVNWARKLPEAIFFELFTCLIEARHEWLKNLDSPPRFRDNDRFVYQIDAFRRKVGDCPKEASHRRGERSSWILVDAVFFNELAGGLDVDEDEEEDNGTKDVINTGKPPDRGCDPHKGEASTKTPMSMKRKQPTQDEPRKKLKR